MFCLSLARSIFLFWLLFAHLYLKLRIFHRFCIYRNLLAKHRRSATILSFGRCLICCRVGFLLQVLLEKRLVLRAHATSPLKFCHLLCTARMVHIIELIFDVLSWCSHEFVILSVGLQHVHTAWVRALLVIGLLFLLYWAVADCVAGDGFNWVLMQNFGWLSVLSWISIGFFLFLLCWCFQWTSINYRLQLGTLQRDRGLRPFLLPSIKSERVLHHWTLVTKICTRIIH